MRTTILRGFSLLVLASLLMVPAALAQGNQQQQQQAPEVDVNNEEVQTVAEVFVEVEEIRESYQAEFQQTEDPQAAQELQQELSQEIEQTIEQKEGITIERYEEIIQAAQVDDQLYQELIAAIEEERGEGASY